MKMYTGMTKTPFPYQDTNYKNADTETISFFHCQDTNTMQTWITQKHFSISSIPNIKMQTGNQIIFPLLEYQYNAYNSKRNARIKWKKSLKRSQVFYQSRHREKPTRTQDNPYAEVFARWCKSNNQSRTIIEVDDWRECPSLIIHAQKSRALISIGLLTLKQRP